MSFSTSIDGFSNEIQSCSRRLRKYLDSSDIVNYGHPTVASLAKALAEGCRTPAEIVRHCFEWVREEVKHSGDFPTEVVTCTASEVAEKRTGLCYAKSHLLAALLRANGVPTAFCYQRLSLGEGQFCLHGLNAVFLPERGWVRLDARGNKSGISCHFDPQGERLPFKPIEEGEADLPEYYADPLPVVVEALRKYQSMRELLAALPDCGPQ